MPDSRSQPAALGATLSNWRTPANNRWAFHNADKLIATERVENDPASVSPLEAAPRQLGNRFLRKAVLGAIRTDAVVVLHHGKIAFEWYSAGHDARTPHILMSATKAVVGLLSTLLHERGDIDLNALASRYVPELSATAYEGATLRHLLDMRTDVELDAEQLQAYDVATGWAPTPSGAADSDLRGFFGRLESPGKVHGTPFKYLSTNTDLLGLAIERATNRSIAALLSDSIWRPMGAQDAAYLTLDRSGLARCAGGLCVTARDLARLGQLIVDGGCRGTLRVIPAAVIGDIVDGGDHAAWREGQWGKSFATISTNMRYRSGWYLVDDEPKSMFAMGIHGQNLFIDRERKLVVAKLSSWKKPVDYLPLWLTHKSFEALRTSLPGS
jgi:CubicO group peptidase (beta-lactamase class C family)